VTSTRSPVRSGHHAAGTNDGTRWVRTQMGTPVGVAVARSGALYYSDATQNTVRVVAAGRVPRDRFGRRTSWLPLPAWLPCRRRRWAAATRSAAESGAGERVDRAFDATAQPGLLRTSGLTVNGLTNPVGIDPDGCWFAWTLQADGRAVAQTAFRVVVAAHGPDPYHGDLGQRPVTSAARPS